MKAVLDTDGNGFIDFNTFKEKFGPNMSKLVQVSERELHLPNLVPNAPKLQEYGEKSKSIRQSLNAVNKSFRPEQDASKFHDSLPNAFCSIELIPSTRFGAKPPHPNTFVNYQPGPNTPGFISENDRFGGAGPAAKPKDGLNTKIGFQKEDKAFKDKLQESKLVDKQRNKERLVTQIQLAEQDQLAKQTSKMLKIAGQHDTYEKLCHL